MSIFVPNFYFTFGVGTVLGKNYAVIKAEDEIQARMNFVEIQGNNNWCSTFSQDEWVHMFPLYYQDLKVVELPAHQAYLSDY